MTIAYVISRKEYCPYCESAKRLLDLKKIEYTEKKVGVDMTREELFALVPTARTVPQIWMDYGTETEKYIGGYDALQEYFKVD